MSRNNFRLYGEEWETFVKDSTYTNVAALHFIKEEADTYYVTAYGEDGSECGGYNRMEIGSRQMRCLATIQNDVAICPVSKILNYFFSYMCYVNYINILYFSYKEVVEQMCAQVLPGDFLQDIVTKEYDVQVGGMFLATVRHRRVRIPGTGKRVKYGNMFFGEGWGEVVESQHLKTGKRIVFTNLGGYSVGVISFAPNGLGLGFENIPRTTLKRDDQIIRGPLEEGMN